MYQGKIHLPILSGPRPFCLCVCVCVCVSIVVLQCCCVSPCYIICESAEWIHMSGLPRCSVERRPPTTQERDAGSIPCSGRCPGGGNGSPLQCSCLGNPVGRGSWWVIAHGVPKSQTQLNTNIASCC